jgi:transposase
MGSSNVDFLRLGRLVAPSGFQVEYIKRQREIMISISVISLSFFRLSVKFTGDDSGLRLYRKVIGKHYCSSPTKKDQQVRNNFSILPVYSDPVLF